MCFPAQRFFRSLSARFLLPDGSRDAGTAASPLTTTGVAFARSQEATGRLPERRAPRLPAALEAAALPINN